MMTLLCIEYKVITVPYFLDEMQYYELSILMDKLNLSVKNDWSIAREIMWSNLTVWSKKKIKPQDIINFPWDNSNKKRQEPVEVTEDLREKMMKKAQARKEALIAAGVI